MSKNSSKLIENFYVSGDSASINLKLFSFCSISGVTLPVQDIRGGVEELDFSSKKLHDTDAIVIGALLETNTSLIELKYVMTAKKSEKPVLVAHHDDK